MNKNQIARFTNDISGDLASVLTTTTSKAGTSSIKLMSQKDFRTIDPATGELRPEKLGNAECKREFAIFRQAWTGKAAGGVSELVANGYTIERVTNTKSGRIGMTIVPPKVDSVSKTEEATQKRIREAVAAALAAERAKSE